MKYDDITKLLAPCGLNCGKCQAYSEGKIKKHAVGLKRLLGSFYRYAERFSGFLPVQELSRFKELLNQFRQANCKGCRQGDCKYPHCGVAPCFKQRGVDFCFQCGEFLCDKTNFDPYLYQRWLATNRRIKRRASRDTGHMIDAPCPSVYCFAGRVKLYIRMVNK